MTDEFSKGTLILVPPTKHFEPLGMRLGELGCELMLAVRKLSGNNTRREKDFFSWLESLYEVTGAVAIYGGPLHSKEARKLQIMLAFMEKKQHSEYIDLFMESPASVDTSICPFFLEGGELPNPKPYFDALLAGPLVLLKETDFMFQKIVQNRRKEFLKKVVISGENVENADLLLLELVTHRVYHRICHDKHVLEDPDLCSFAQDLYAEGAGSKLGFLARIAEENEVIDCANREFGMLRLKDDRALKVSRTMATLIQKAERDTPRARQIR